MVSKQLNLADLAAPLGTEATPARKSNSLARPAPAPVPTAPTLLLPDADLQVQRVRAMDADVHFDPIATDGPSERVGTLTIPMSARFVINDGQHRRAGIQQALAENPALGDMS